MKNWDNKFQLNYLLIEIDQFQTKQAKKLISIFAFCVITWNFHRISRTSMQFLCWNIVSIVEKGNEQNKIENC